METSRFEYYHFVDVVTYKYAITQFLPQNTFLSRQSYSCPRPPGVLAPRAKLASAKPSVGRKAMQIITIKTKNVITFEFGYY